MSTHPEHRPIAESRTADYLTSMARGSAQRLDTEARQQQIAEAALKVIARQGLRRFTVAAIAREVGLTSGALFKHFPDKDAIVTAALERVEATMFAGFPPAHSDPLERLGLFFQHRLEAITANPHIGALVTSDQLVHVSGDISGQRVAQWQLRSSRFIRACLEEAAAAGSLREGVEIDAMIVLIHGAIRSLGVANRPRMDAPGLEPQRLWSNLRRLLER